MVELPREIWMHIAGISHRKDLIQLALVSRLHLALIRPMLAEKITIRELGGSSHDTRLKFLVETRLSSHIKSFGIYGFEKDGAPDLPFSTMLRLRSLSIGSCHAFSMSKQKEMVKALRVSCTDLRTIVVTSAYSMFPHKNFSLSNVETVEWNEAGQLSPALFSLYKASLSTIENLTIHVLAPAWPQDEVQHAGIKTYKRFFRLHFPNLSSLDIGPGHYSLALSREDETNGAFTEFLLRHSTLEKLVLPHREHNASQSDFYLPVIARRLVGPNVLPGLQYFEAHPRLIAELLEEDVHFLVATVETLFISEAFHIFLIEYNLIELGEDEDLIPLVSVLYRLEERRARVLNVKDLIVHLSKITDDDGALDVVRPALLRTAEFFPHLETWIGSIPVLADDFVSLFSQFPQIRVITGILGGRAEIEEDAVLKVAQQCQFLDRVTCLVTDRSYVVERKWDAGKHLISIRLEECPKFAEDSQQRRFLVSEDLHRTFKREEWYTVHSDDDSSSSSSSDDEEGGWR